MMKTLSICFLIIFLKLIPALIMPPSSTVTSSSAMAADGANTDASFAARYAKRLKLPEEALVDSEPTHELLCRLHEAHVTTVPFENLAQHGGSGGPVVLELAAVADKVLNRNRGGFCLELNSLFRALLEACGYTVTAVKASIFKRGAFDVENPTHVVLIVRTHPSSPVAYYADVAVGEPPLHPLEFAFDKEQVTPEGMRSRFVRDGPDHAVLQWFKDGEWQPRISWRISSALSGARGVSTVDLQPILELVSRPDSNFSRKLIVCLLSRDKKRTVAGSMFKVTGSPRFGDGKDEPPVESTENIPVERVREILRDEFSIPMIETMDLDLTISNQQDRSVWAEK
jgi:arylamine N-acetyltransferase